VVNFVIKKVDDIRVNVMMKLCEAKITWEADWHPKGLTATSVVRYTSMTNQKGNIAFIPIGDGDFWFNNELN
jgi:negative regulator of sigma E activity